ncbi:UNVERIFIED_CONTAM: hypothetical protein FKN15_059595 [Acipenser sinensis]
MIWKNNVDDFVVDQQSGFPISRVSAVTGKKVFVEKQHMVYPVVGFPDPAISRAAKRLVRQHHDKFAPTCRILQQRQTIELIPITKASYSFQEKEYTYFVYGAEHKVYTEDYPANDQDDDPQFPGPGNPGQVVDSYGSCVPAPWDIAVQVPAMFQNGKRAVQVPHTSSVKVEMYRRIITRVTQAASIYRQKGCTECSGSGSKTCHTCAGKGQLLFFINLIVEWKNHIYEFVPDKRSGFPVDRVSKVTGELLFTDTQYMVYPVVSFPDNAINQASQTAVREHQAQFVTTSRILQQVYPVVSFPDNAINQASQTAVREHQAQFVTTSRILQQRQTIELIPVTRVHYTWKEKTYIYFVYGAEHKVYTDDYPAKCCCCTII